MSEYFELDSIELYIAITKCKSSSLSIVVPSNFMIHLVNGAQFLKTTGVGLLCTIVTISPLDKMKTSFPTLQVAFN